MRAEAQTAPAEPAPLVALPEMAFAAPAAAAQPAAAEPLVEAPASAAPRVKKTWREERWERRRRRIWFEELLGWILVPLIVVGLYYVAVATLAALGTSPAAIMDGINAILAQI
jgi:hypothetical protein